MRLSIEPIDERHRESLKRHLAPFGLPAEIVEWKYFRRSLRQEGDRGFVWVRQGEVRGAIGLIPFSVRGPANVMRASWTCDWVVDDPQSNPGVGVMLIHRARDAAGVLFSLGGNERNRQLMPRIATTSVDEAAIEMHVPLRAGGSAWFRGLDRRLGGALRPLRGLRLKRGGGTMVFQPGVSPELESLLDVQRGAWLPAYDLPYLKWQIEECPVLQSASCVSTGGNAGALCWASKWQARDWRLALWTRDDKSAEAAGVLAAVFRYVYERGGERMSSIVSHHDRSRLTLLESHGFVDSDQRKPLYVTAARSLAVEPLGAHSFVDSDLAYRF
jgi:hypothetical protein